MKAFFILCGIIALAGAGWYLVISKTSVDGAQIIFKGPEKIFYGVPFKLSVGVGNNSGDLWNNVGLSLSLPQGFAFADNGGASSFAIKQLGNLGDGSLTEVAFMLIAIQNQKAGFENQKTGSQELATETIEANLAYVPAGGAVVFEKKEQWHSSAPEAGVTVQLTAPPMIASGEELKITVRYANMTTMDMDMIAVRMNYPDHFVFIRSTTEPDSGTNMWNVGALRAGASDSIVIFGRLEKATDTLFTATLMRTVNGSRQIVHETEAKVVSEQSPLTVVIDANDSPDYAARLGETITYTISYVFEKSVEKARGGITVRATLAGQLFDMESVVINNDGTLRRDIKTGAPQIVWQIPQVDVEGGSVEFKINIKNEYGIKRFGDRNFTATIRAEAQTGNIMSFADHEIKIAGATTVEARGYFRDAAAGILNKGALPPKVHAPTQYTIHWKLKNYATDVKKINVRATIASGVRFTGVVKSTVDTKPVYNTATGEVVWTMERISATTSLMGAAPEVIFQIEGTPTPDMAGKPMLLMGPTTVSGLDDFTGLSIGASAPAITTALPHDPTVGNTGIVIQ